MTTDQQVSNWNIANVLTVLRIAMVPLFGWALLHDGGEDALCAKHAKIELESLEENEGPEEDQPHTGQGLNLSDDRCDAFHIYWNPKSKDFEYWRL